MSYVNSRRMLVALGAVVASAALAPMASASITPTVTLTQGTTQAATTNTSLGIDIKFAPTSGDTVKDLTVSLPPGLLDDATIDSGACVAATTGTAACQIASGTASAGGYAPPVTMDLVKAPAAGDVAGLVLNVAGTPIATGGIAVRPATSTLGVGLDLVFTNLPSAAALSELNVTFSGIRMPATCPTTPAVVTLTANSQSVSSNVTATAPVTVTGCSTLPFAPVFSAAATKDASDTQVSVLTTITQAATESPSSGVKIVIPSNISPNLLGAAGDFCASATYTGCAVIGTARAVTPLLPVPLTGNIYLTGSVAAPVMTIDLSSPFQLLISGAIGITSNSVDFTGVPDVPLTSLAVLLSGGSSGLFETTCSPATATATAAFTDANGDKTANASAPLTIKGCSAGGTTPPPTKTPGKPTLSASLGRLSSGNTSLKAKVSAGNNGAPDLASATIGLPKGASFVKSAIPADVSVSGGKVKATSLKGGKLTVSLKSAASSFTIKVKSAALAISQSLAAKVESGKTKTLTLTVTVKDAKGTSTKLTQTVKV